MPRPLEVFSVVGLEADAGAFEIKARFFLEGKEVLVIIFKNNVSPYKALFCIFTATLDEVSQL